MCLDNFLLFSSPYTRLVILFFYLRFHLATRKWLFRCLKNSLTRKKENAEFSVTVKNNFSFLVSFFPATRSRSLPATPASSSSARPSRRIWTFQRCFTSWPSVTSRLCPGGATNPPRTAYSRSEATLVASPATATGITKETWEWGFRTARRTSRMTPAAVGAGAAPREAVRATFTQGSSPWTTRGESWEIIFF